MICFNRPYLTGSEVRNIKTAYKNGMLAGDGPFTQKCQTWLEKNLGTKKALLTHSCTSALEMAALLAGITPGDEVIMPSFTFVSTANAFVLRGARPVFVDIRRDTLNINEKLIESAITNKTKAIVPVHYAGLSCAMDEILAIAKKHKLLVIEDAAHGLIAKYKNRELGTMGDLGVLSFHETKNIISGEGGALLINNKKFIKRAEIIWQKGTDRARFFRGEVDKYTWRDFGSSFLPGEITASFLWAQLQSAKKITQMRMLVWKKYAKGLQDLEKKKLIQLPHKQVHASHNAHLFYFIITNTRKRNKFLKIIKTKGVSCAFHYVPLHKSPFGKRKCRVSGSLLNTEQISESIVRLPIWIGIKKFQKNILKKVNKTFENNLF